jgi:hypothetical protein
LKVWQRAHALVLEIYRISGGLPPAADAGLSTLNSRQRGSTACPLVAAEPR